MKITTGEGGVMVLEEVYNPIKMITNSGEGLLICMRDSGFEIVYGGQHYSMQSGKVAPLSDLCKKDEKIASSSELLKTARKFYVLEINDDGEPKASLSEIIGFWRKVDKILEE